MTISHIEQSWIITTVLYPILNPPSMDPTWSLLMICHKPTKKKYGRWLTYPSEKYESQLGWWHSQYTESHKSHVPNHQPDQYFIAFFVVASQVRKFPDTVVPGGTPKSIGSFKPWGLFGSRRIPHDWRNPWKNHHFSSAKIAKPLK